MIELLGSIKIKTGEIMNVKVITPPAEEEYAEKLCRFLEHKRASFRDIKQRLRGDYSNYCVDKYFIGEIDGNIVSQLWYGYASSGSGIGNFGHVYTEPKHRKKGITNELMKFFLEDFNNSTAEAVFCSTGTPWVAKIYLGYGFQTIIDGAKKGPLMLLKKDDERSFEEIEKIYFSAGQDVEVVSGTMQYRHDIDKMLADSLFFRNIQWNRISASFHASTYRDAYYLTEDGKGIIAVAKNSDGKVVGWAFALNTGSDLEEKSKAFDFVIHPNYKEKKRQLIDGTLKIASRNGVERVFSYVPEVEEGKIENLIQAGFKIIATIPQYCSINNRASDVMILKKEIN
jgi:GNAT superfamily N-acetyltransferase